LQYLDKLIEWMHDNADYNLGIESRLINLLERVGWRKLIWMNVFKDHTRVEFHTSDINPESISNLTNSFDVDTLNNINTKSTNPIIINNQELVCLFNAKKSEGNQICIFSFDSSATSSVVDAMKIAKIGFEFIQKSIKINALQQSLRVAYSGINSYSTDEPSMVSIQEIPIKFIEDSIPAIFYSIAHEILGPSFVLTDPVEFNQPINMILPVNLFSTLDSNMISEVGQVFSINPVSKPILGEVVSIVFSIANKNARGGFELHGISIVISQQFSNLSKSILIDLKSLLFSGAEAIRQKLDIEDWKLFISDDFDTNPEIRSFILPLIKNMRENLAGILAKLLSPDEVKKWN